MYNSLDITKPLVTITAVLITGQVHLTDSKDCLMRVVWSTIVSESCLILICKPHWGNTWAPTVLLLQGNLQPQVKVLPQLTREVVSVSAVLQLQQLCVIIHRRTSDHQDVASSRRFLVYTVQVAQPIPLLEHKYPIVVVRCDVICDVVVKRPEGGYQLQNVFSRAALGCVEYQK